MDCNTCECYKVEHKAVYSEDGRCMIESEERCAGTKEMDVCDCRGNKLCCDFYPEKRRKGGECMNKNQSIGYIRDRFNLSEGVLNLLRNIFLYAETRIYSDEERLNFLNFMLNGTIGLSEQARED